MRGSRSCTVEGQPGARRPSLAKRGRGTTRSVAEGADRVQASTISFEAAFVDEPPARARHPRRGRRATYGRRAWQTRPRGRAGSGHDDPRSQGGSATRHLERPRRHEPPRVPGRSTRTSTDTRPVYAVGTAHRRGGPRGGFSRRARRRRRCHEPRRSAAPDPAPPGPPALSGGTRPQTGPGRARWRPPATTSPSWRPMPPRPLRMAGRGLEALRDSARSTPPCTTPAAASTWPWCWPMQPDSATLSCSLRHLCLSEDCAEPLRARGAASIAIAERPDEDALLALLDAPRR